MKLSCLENKFKTIIKIAKKNCYAEMVIKLVKNSPKSVVLPI